DLNPHETLGELEDQLGDLRRAPGRDLRVAGATKLVFKLAFHQASRAGRQTIESSDLFSAIFEESQGISASIIRRHGVEPDVLLSRTNTPIRHTHLPHERLPNPSALP